MGCGKVWRMGGQLPGQLPYFNRPSLPLAGGNEVGVSSFQIDASHVWAESAGFRACTGMRQG